MNVSIIVPTYNRADLLGLAIKSVISQSCKDWELLIIDDGSTDNTRSVVAEFTQKDDRIKYFYQENKGQGAARNVGIQNAQGEFIAFLDSDDEWLPKKLEDQVAFLDKHPEYDFCYTADVIFHSDGRSVIKRYSNSLGLTHMKLAGKGISVPSSHMYRKKVFDEVGLFNESRDLIGLEDNEWSVRASSLRGFYIDKSLTVYRVHAGQITKENIEKKLKKQIRGLAFILRKNFSIIAKDKKALLFRIGQIVYLQVKYVVRI